MKLAARRAAFTHPAAGKPSLREQIEAVAVAAGRDAEAFTRRWLTLLLVEGDALEAERSAVEQWGRLRRHGAEQQRLLIESGGEFCNWALAVLIAEESVVAAVDSPKRARELAELAQLIAASVPGGEARRRRVMGYVGSFVTNAWRVSGDLKAADLALVRADNDWIAGDPWGLDALQETRRLDLASSLRRDQRRLEEALGFLDSALATGPRGAVKARLLVKKAKVLEKLSEPEACSSSWTWRARTPDGVPRPRSGGTRHRPVSRACGAQTRETGRCLAPTELSRGKSAGFPGPRS